MIKNIYYDLNKNYLENIDDYYPRIIPASEIEADNLPTQKQLETLNVPD